ncbi:MAG: hypothetical protein ABW025_11460 [Cellulomonas sp.]
MTVLLGTAVATALAGCAVGQSGKPSAPVPDDVLFDQVAELPGVRSSAIRWERNFGNTPFYMGTITAEDAADPLCVLDEALAVLYQGRQDTSLRAVEVEQGGTTVRAEDLDGETPLGERYGPRPTEPQPTATLRACTPPSLGGPTSSPTTR